jgi:hypothetical protein
MKAKMGQKGQKGPMARKGMPQKIAVIPFNPGLEFFPHIAPHLRPALMDNLFRIYRRML